MKIRITIIKTDMGVYPDQPSKWETEHTEEEFRNIDEAISFLREQEDYEQ